MINSHEERIQEIKKIVTPILKDNGVVRAYLFGSYARGDETEESDVDLLIDFGENRKSLFDISDIRCCLSEVLNCSIDLVTIDSLNGDPFSINVNKDKVLIYDEK